MIAIELMNHVAVPLRWKEFRYHVGLMAGGKDIEEGQQTVFFTPLDPLVDETTRRMRWLCRSREKCTTRISGRFLRTQSIGPIWEKRKSRDYISGRQGLPPLDNILGQRIPTPRPAPMIVFKDAWQVEQGKLKKQRETSSNLISVFKEFHKMSEKH